MGLSALVANSQLEELLNLATVAGVILLNYQDCLNPRQYILKVRGCPCLPTEKSINTARRHCEMHCGGAKRIFYAWKGH